MSVDDLVVVIETDKVTVDIKSSKSGILTRQIANEVVCNKNDDVKLHSLIHY